MARAPQHKSPLLHPGGSSTASTTVTDTLGSNTDLLSPRPPQSPLGQDTSPASFDPF